MRNLDFLSDNFFTLESEYCHLSNFLTVELLNASFLIDKFCIFKHIHWKSIMHIASERKFLSFIINYVLNRVGMFDTRFFRRIIVEICWCFRKSFKELFCVKFNNKDEKVKYPSFRPAHKDLKNSVLFDWRNMYQHLSYFFI